MIDIRAIICMVIFYCLETVEGLKKSIKNNKSKKSKYTEIGETYY